MSVPAAVMRGPTRAGAARSGPPRGWPYDRAEVARVGGSHLQCRGVEAVDAQDREVAYRIERDDDGVVGVAVLVLDRRLVLTRHDVRVRDDETRGRVDEPAALLDLSARVALRPTRSTAAPASSTVRRQRTLRRRPRVGRFLERAEHRRIRRVGDRPAPRRELGRLLRRGRVDDADDRGAARQTARASLSRSRAKG